LLLFVEIMALTEKKHNEVIWNDIPTNDKF